MLSNPRSPWQGIRNAARSHSVAERSGTYHPPRHRPRRIHPRRHPRTRPGRRHRRAPARNRRIRRAHPRHHQLPRTLPRTPLPALPWRPLRWPGSRSAGQPPLRHPRRSTKHVPLHRTAQAQGLQGRLPRTARQCTHDRRTARSPHRRMHRRLPHQRLPVRAAGPKGRRGINLNASMHKPAGITKGADAFASIRPSQALTILGVSPWQPHRSGRPWCPRELHAARPGQ